MACVVKQSRLVVGCPSTGSANELFFSISAAVVGGVSLFGGVGSVLGAMLGALLIATVSNGMTLLSVPSFWQPLVIGLIILLGVIVDTYRRRFNEVRQAVRVLRSRAGGKADQNQEHVTGSAVEEANPEPGISNSSLGSES